MVYVLRLHPIVIRKEASFNEFPVISRRKWLLRNARSVPF